MIFRSRTVAMSVIVSLATTGEWEFNLRTFQAETLASSSRHEFEVRVNHLLHTLNLSHVGFEHESLDRCSAGRALCATYDAFEINNVRRWMFRDVHEDGPAHQAGIRKGDVLLGVGSAAFNPPEHPGFQIPSITNILISTGGDHQILKSDITDRQAFIRERFF
jgi:hypothetical protein